MATVDIELANWALDEARREGGRAAEVLCVNAESLEAGVRMGEVEKLKSSRERRLGLRVFGGQSSATSSTAELERDSLGAFVASTVELARLSAADPWAGLPEPALHPKSLPELSLADPDSGIVSADRALEIARTGENAALKFDPRIKNSGGAEFNSGRGQILFANSQGFVGENGGTSKPQGGAPVAQVGEARQQGYWCTPNLSY